jgi:TRAP-type mannitol/chloroaromatic compound transport system substrate-binding protein
MKFYEAAQYYYYPGFHEPGSMLAAGVNWEWWNNLSDHDRMTIETAATAENEIMMSEYNANNGTYLARLIEEQGVELRSFNDDVYDSFGAASDEVFEETRQHSDLANRIHESFLQARADVGSWQKLADVGYIQQRNRVLGV